MKIRDWIQWSILYLGSVMNTLFNRMGDRMAEPSVRSTNTCCSQPSKKNTQARASCTKKLSLFSGKDTLRLSGHTDILDSSAEVVTTQTAHGSKGKINPSNRPRRSKKYRQLTNASPVCLQFQELHSGKRIVQNMYFNPTFSNDTNASVLLCSSVVSIGLTAEILYSRDMESNGFQLGDSSEHTWNDVEPVHDQNVAAVVHFNVIGLLQHPTCSGKKGTKSSGIG